MPGPFAESLRAFRTTSMVDRDIYRLGIKGANSDPRGTNKMGRKRTRELACVNAGYVVNDGSSMDQHRDLAMGENLDRLAAQDDRGDAMAAVRGHDDQIATLRPRGIDDRLVRMLVLNLDRLACDAGCLRSASGGAKGFRGVLLHAYPVLSWRVLDHLRVDR